MEKNRRDDKIMDGLYLGKKEIRMKICNEMKQGDFLIEVSILVKDMKYQGYYGPYLIISHLDVEFNARKLLYENIGISEYQRVVEKKSILDWNGWKYSNELDEARKLDTGMLILRQCSKEDLRKFNKNNIKIEIKEIKEKLDKLEKMLE